MGGGARRGNVRWGEGDGESAGRAAALGVGAGAGGVRSEPSSGAGDTTPPSASGGSSESGSPLATARPITPTARAATTAAAMKRPREPLPRRWRPLSGASAARVRWGRAWTVAKPAPGHPTQARRFWLLRPGTPKICRLGTALAATPTTLKFGLSTTAYGHVTPRQRGQTVTLMDQNGHVLARPTTNAEGRYKASFVPRKTIWLHAQWKGAKSPAVRIRVRAVVTVGLGHVLLFGNAVAWGKVRPIRPGARVEVVLVRGNTPVARQFVPMGRRGEFKTRLYVPMPGTYPAR